MKLKEIFVMTIVILLSGASVFADDGQTQQQMNQQITDVDIGQYTSVEGPGYSESSAEGGEASAGAGAFSSLSTTSISKPKVRIPLLSGIPPYLPYWAHGGWGIVKAYFPNGPSSDEKVYERTFNPNNKEDVEELWSVLNAIPSYDGPVEFFWWGCVTPIFQIFGAPNLTHRGKGFEIANAFIRDRRPKGKPFFVFIDSGIDKEVLEKRGYAYVGKVGVTGSIKRNWDQCYNAIVAETLPWDVDILLVSGGMKGVTVGSANFFPGGGGGYSQTNYSLSLFGGKTTGITEGKGKAMVSAEGYRYWPEALKRRKIPDKYNFVTESRREVSQPEATPQAAPSENNKKKAAEIPTSITGIPIKNPELLEKAGYNNLK